MANPTRGTRGMAVAPHSLASQSALAVLREGGNAVEAMIAAAPQASMPVTLAPSRTSQKLSPPIPFMCG